MKEKVKYKAILFDSGKVLNAPASGHWFISPNFFKIVNKETFSKIDQKKISKAFKKANEYIDSQSKIETKNEELLHFINFYHIFSSCIPELNLNQKEIELLTKDLVFNYEKYTFYDDALKVIPKLNKKYKLGIVSDAWPSLKDVYAYKELVNYFDSFIISSQIGVTKPHKLMYQKALDELKVFPDQAVFIDDHLVNVYGAMDLGISGILLCRNKWGYRWNKIKSIGKKYLVINHLEELLELLNIDQ